MHGPSTTMVTGPVAVGSTTSPSSLVTTVRSDSFLISTTVSRSFSNASRPLLGGAHLMTYALVELSGPVPLIGVA